MELKVGSVLLDRYKIKRFITRGDKSHTYLARDILKNYDVVLKVLVFSEIKDWEVFELFEKEAGVLKNISFPFIPKYIKSFEVDYENDKLYVLEQQYIKGENLEDLVKRGSKFTLDEIVEIFIKLLKILDYIHTLLPPLIHRDINPKNIIMNKNRNVYLVDFNAVGSIVKSNLTSTDSFIGAAGYTAMEQYHGEVLPQSDIYSLGATIIFLLTGKEPVNIELKDEKLNYKNYVSIPDYLSALIDRMIEPKVEDRLKSAIEALKVLDKNYSKEKKVTEKEKPALCEEFDVNEKDEYGTTQLMTEVKNNNYDLVKLLIERGADVNAKDSNGWTALAFAVKNSNEKIIKLLLKNGVNINAKNNEGASVLTYAVLNDLERIVNLLIRNNIDINAKDNDGKTALKHTVLENKKNMIKLLIEKGAKLDDVDVNSEEMKGVLTDKKGEDLNKQDNQGKTQLMKAIFDYEDDLAKILISKGADLNIKDKKGKAALIYTIIHERPLIASLLIEKGADVNTTDNKGMTALMWACDYRNAKFTKLLVDNGADINATDKQGNTAKVYATTKKTKNILKQAGLR